MASTSRGARSRQAIVATGAELFAERGFANTGLNDVLDRVGLTKGGGMLGETPSGAGPVEMDSCDSDLRPHP